MLEIINITKKYHYQKVIDSLSMTLPDCGLIAVVGKSGCGKTTLLNIIGGIDKDYSGQILFNNKNIRFIKKNIGYLFQSFHLISWLNVINNIRLPLFFKRGNLTYQDMLGLKDLKRQNISNLSLGQRQRIAFLRAFSFDSRIVLCDEPTASLDELNAIQLMELLKEESSSKLIILVSHDMEVVKKYSDEIFYMEDGKIINHQIINQPKKIEDISRYKKAKKPKLFLSLYALFHHRSRTIQMIIALTLSLSCIILTFSISQGFYNQLYEYIDSLVPASSISFRLKSHGHIHLQDLNDFNNESYVLHSHLFLNQYELIAFGEVRDKYNSQYIIEIGNDSGFIKDELLLKGRMMKNNDEIVVSKEAAMRYLQSKDVEMLIGREVNLWYKHLNKVRGKKVKIVGIYENKDQFNSIYYLKEAHFSHIESLFHDNSIMSTYGILYVNDSTKDYHKLVKKYHQYEFKEVGKGTKDQMNSFMEKIKYVLMSFSLLAILSSVFLIGEVMFLEVVQKKKDIAIMKCFHANYSDISLFIFNQSFIIYLIACFFSFVIFVSFQSLFNHLFSMDMLFKKNLISIDYHLLFIIYSSGFLLLIFSQIIPLIYAFRINIAKLLRSK